MVQMSGRAGRPPFDDTGMVIIMTRRETVNCSAECFLTSTLPKCFNFNHKLCSFTCALIFLSYMLVFQVHLYENLLSGCEVVESQ
jgi:replicative superfamily II helicase